MDGTLHALPVASGAGAVAPAIAVWVLAFGQRPTLPHALRSVNGQDVPPTRRELLVLSDRPAPPEFASMATGATWVRLPSAPLGQWIGPALARTRAPLIAFLDDDDAFVPGKLGAALEWFRDHPELRYLHHRVERSELDPSPRRPPRGARGDAAAPSPALYLRPSDRDARSVEKFWACGGAFNHSSVVVRRELLESLLTPLAELRGGITPLLCYGALASDGALAEDARAWTVYGVHAGSESPLAARGPFDLLGRNLRIGATRRHDADVILGYLRASGVPLSLRPLTAARARYRLFELLGSSGSGRRELLEAYAVAARLRGSHQTALLLAAGVLTASRLAGLRPFRW